jgi:integrase
MLKMPMNKKEYEFLNGYETVQKMRNWFLRKVGRKEWFSENSYLQYLNGVRHFMESEGFENPDQVIETLRDTGKAEKLLNSWIDKLNDLGWSPNTQIHYFSYMKRFLLSNDIEVNWRKVVLPKGRKVVADKAPTKEELRTILMYGPTWLKAAVLLLATSGLRVGSLAYLKLKHVKFDFDSQVGLVEVPPEATKAKVGYYTFFTEETRGLLRKHLEERKKKGEVLSEESALIKPAMNQTANYDSIRHSYTRTLRKAGLTVMSQRFHILHIHTLRKYFRTNLEAILTRSQIERLMGHVSTEYLDGSYFRPPEKDMLENYRRAIPNLTVMIDVQNEDYQKKQLLRQAALLLDSDKLSRLKEILARSKTVDSAVEQFRRFQEESEEQRKAIARPRTEHNGNGRYLVVHSEDEMIQKLHEGYSLVQSLSNDKFLLEVHKPC